MADRIYHMSEQGQLEPMVEEPFAAEDLLQALVADHPELLSGEQINPAEPRRWILIRREQGIAKTPGGADHWAVDHLLIDQDAVPTLVEVKRSANSEIRRTIVGQMLDYAAHATRTWDVGDIRRSFEESNEDSDDVLSKLLQVDGEVDADEFWQRVETNLRAARLRLLFVADGIPDELTRVVEFLNEQMPGIEVLAVEIKQFRGVMGQTLVPRVIGRTTTPGPSRSSSSRSRINLEEFFAQMPSPQIRDAAERLMQVAKENRAGTSPGSTGISIRSNSPAWNQPITVAWLYPIPEKKGWMNTKNFSFGEGSGRLDSMPDNLRQILQAWVDGFQGLPYTTDVSSVGVQAYAITHQDAAANIDVLAERLGNVLRSLQQLDAPLE